MRPLTVRADVPVYGTVPEYANVAFRRGFAIVFDAVAAASAVFFVFAETREAKEKEYFGKQSEK